MSHENVIELVENDTQPEIQVTYEETDVTGYESLELHIKYKPNPLTINAVLDEADETSFSFPWTGRVEAELAAEAAAGAEAITVTVTGAGQTFDDLPSSGEVLIDDGSTKEYVLYSSKSAPATLNLASPLENAFDSGVSVEKLPDLRAGKWPAEIEVVDADGGRLTFPRVILDIKEEIA